MRTLQECYKILGVKPDASAQESRKAYLALVKRWHPDAHSHDPDSKAKAKEQFFQIQTAYEQIKTHQDAASDTPPEHKIADPVEAPSPTQKVSTELTAQKLYDSATALGNKGLYRDAIAELSFAIRIDPKFILAYQYRGHLNSMLGLEYQAEADLNKADALKRLGNSATGKSQADIESFARKYPRANPRSPVRHNRKLSPQPSTKTLLMGSAIAAGVILIGFIVLRSSEQPQHLYPQPFNIESPAIES